MAKSKSEPNSTRVKSPNVDAVLHMFANCAQDVNDARAEFRGNIAVSKKRKLTPPFRHLNLIPMPKDISGLEKRKAFTLWFNSHDSVTKSARTRVT